MFIPNKWKISCDLRTDLSVMGWVQLASGPEKCCAAVEAGWGDHGEPQYSILCWRTNGSLQRFLGRCIPRNQPMSCKWGFFWDAISLYIYIFFFLSRQGSKAARAVSVGFSTRFSSFFLRWNEPHHFRASTSIEDDGAISERKKNMPAAEGGGFGILRCLEPSKNPGFWSSAREESLENWPKFSWIILGLSWYLNLFDLLLLFLLCTFCTLQNHPLWTPHNDLHQKSPVQSRLQLVWSGLTRLFRLDDDGAEMVEAYELKVYRCSNEGLSIVKGCPQNEGPVKTS